MHYKIPIEIIELEQGNYHIVVTSLFEDGREGKWVVDTGASKSIFDQNLSKYYQPLEGISEELHSAGFNDEPIKSSVAILDAFTIRNFKCAQMKVAIMDLSHINALYSKTAHLEICGLLGGDFLINRQAVIDYKRKRIILRM